MKNIIIISLMLLGLYLIMVSSIGNGFIPLFLYWLIIVYIAIILLTMLIHKKWKQGAFLLLMVTIMSYLYYMTGLQIPPMFREVLNHYSESVSESKKIKTFICEYKSIYGSQYNIKTKESFAEYRHEFKNYMSRKFDIDKNSSWFVAHIEEIADIKTKGYDKKWEIEKLNNGYIIMPIQLEDTIVVHIIDVFSKQRIDSIVYVKLASKL